MAPATKWTEAVYTLVVAALTLLGVLAGGGLANRVTAQDGVRKDGLFLTVPNPITDNAVVQIKKKVEDALERQKRRRIDTIVFDFNPYDPNSSEGRGQPSGTSHFGSCYDLAEYIRNLRLGQVKPIYPKMTTVAFVHNEVSKHTVLPMLACGQIIMSDQVQKGTTQYLARFGDVLRGQDGRLTDTQRRAYETVADNFASRDLIFRMIDKDLVLRKVKTRDGGVRYVAEKRLRESQLKDEIVAVEPGIPLGLETGKTMFEPDKAREFGLCQAIYNTRAEVATALKLPPQSLVEDWLQGRTPVAWRIEVRGPLEAGKLSSLQRRLKNAIRQGGNLLVLHLDCEGGDSVDVGGVALELSQLKDDLGLLPVKTVAYVPPGRALGAASFLALGCHEIIMAKGAVLGDFSYLKDSKPADFLEKKQMLVKLATDRGYPPLLFEAMLDNRMELRRVKARNDPSDERVLTREMVQDDQKAANPRWVDFGAIDKPEGPFFKLTAAAANEWGVAQLIDSESKGFDELYALLDRVDPTKVRISRDDWLDQVAEFFRQPWVNFLLIMIGIVGLILELKMPGVSLPGVISALCFVLFFWAHSFVGQFTMLAVMLFVLGLILLGVEIFVLPGFGVTGFSGILLVIGSLVLVTLEKMPETTQDWVNLSVTLATFGISMVGAMVAAFMLAWYLPHIPYANRLMLAPPGENGEEADLPGPSPAMVALLGAIGVTVTPLHPAGKARFGDDFLDVIAEGDYVNPGSRVQVIEIEGNRIVVKEV